MEFSHQTTCEGLRTGELNFTKEKKTTILTPGCFLYTRGGAIPHLLPDISKTIHDQPRAAQITLPTVVEQPGCDVIKEVDGGLSKFLQLQDYVTYLSIQDPAQNVPDGYNEEKIVSVWAPSGRRRVDIKEFILLCKVFKTDIVECLCDTVPPGQTAKRTRRSVDRTLKYLDEVLEAQQKDEELKELRIFGVIEGSDSEKERKRSAQETAKRSVHGFVLEGFNSEQDWQHLLKITTSELPEDKPRVIHNMGTIDKVLEAVESGVDLFDSSFPYQVTQRGCALKIPSHSKLPVLELNYVPFVPPNSKNTSDNKNTESKNDGKEGEFTEWEINLSENRFKDDFTPLVRGCSCHCCLNYTRAYLHHLLETKEMLAQVLLMVHNFQQYFQFFNHLREAVKNGQYKDFKLLFHRSERE